MLEASLKKSKILRWLKFLYYVDFTDIIQCVALKGFSESFGLDHQVIQMQGF